MRIRELYLKNFGKFSEQHFYIQNGIQVIYGENEFGKSTLHAFIRAMFFGMERGRGRAAGKDAFSRFEPWENPNYYAGVMRFECGGRNFRLERSFDRISKHASLVCEDDGEELSVEDGDLNMLLGGITQAEFDSTVSVGQLMARPGQELSETLKNYAANYYETGGGEIDLNGALSDLKERRREVERDLKVEQQKQEEKRRSLAQECIYLERDMEKLKREFAEKRSAAEKAEKDAERREAEQARRRNRSVPGRNAPGGNECIKFIKCLCDAPCEPGDALWVRETWQFIPCIDCRLYVHGGCRDTPVTYEDKDSVSEGCFVYRADYPEPDRLYWHPSIHMPRQAARIFLRVTGVRVERLQDIDDDGVLSEGLEIGAPFDELWNRTVKPKDRPPLRLGGKSLGVGYRV